MHPIPRDTRSIGTRTHNSVPLPGHPTFWSVSGLTLLPEWRTDARGLPLRLSVPVSHLTMSEETELQASLVYVVINVLPVRMRRVKEKDVAAENSDNIFRTNRGKYIWHIEWDVDAPKYPLRFLGAEQNRRKASNSRMADEKRQAAGGEGHRKSSWRSPTPLRVEFVGVPPIYVPSAARYGVDKILSHSFQCHPVFLEREVAHQHYQGFCKGALWPIMHNVIDMYNSADYTSMLDSWRPSADSGRSISSDGKSGTTDNDETDWKPRRSWNPLAQEQCWPHHCAANAAFAHKLQVIGADLGEGAGSPIIWVHGYELLLLPSYLLRKVPGANVGLFLDLPFPSSEIFRTLVSIRLVFHAQLIVRCRHLFSFLNVRALVLKTGGAGRNSAGHAVRQSHWISLVRVRSALFDVLQAHAWGGLHL